MASSTVAGKGAPLCSLLSLAREGKALEKVLALVRAHPYATAATVAVVAGTWAAYEAYVVGPAHRRRRQQEKRHARVNRDSALGLGFKNCPETVEAIELAVEGDLPRWLSGKLFRSGPGILEVDTKLGFTYLITHWFDGLTVMHGFEIKDGRVFYANKKAAREVESYIARHGGETMTFGPDPCKTTFEKVSSLFIKSEGKDPETGRDQTNVGVTIKKIRGKFYNCTDANALVEFDPETLETSGKQESYLKFNPDLKGVLSVAHGQYDSARGEYYNLVCDVGATALYTLFVIPDQGEARVLCTIPAKQAAYLHSFALTEHYFILQVWPLFINGVKVMWHKSVVDAMEWKGDETSKFYVVDRNTGELLHTYETASAFCFHNINAWEEDDGNRIVIDLSLFKDNAVINDLVLDNVLSDHSSFSHNQLARYTLTNVRKDSATARCVLKQVVFNEAFDLPRINPSQHMKPYTFGYAVSVRRDEGPAFFNRLVKVNVKTGESWVWEVKGHYPAEPIFLASPEGEEDDGILLSIVLDGETASSYLLVLNAKDMTEIARARVPHHIPFGFHGNFFGQESNSDVM